MPGQYAHDDDPDDDGLNHIRMRHHRELAAKEHAFQQEQAMKQHQLHANMAAKVYQYHQQHGDGPTRELAQSLLLSGGHEHVMGIAQHLHHGGARATAQLLAEHLSGFNG
jgi:hypothetical protein